MPTRVEASDNHGFEIQLVINLSGDKCSAANIAKIMDACLLTLSGLE